MKLLEEITTENTQTGSSRETSDGFKLGSEFCSFWSQRKASAFRSSPSFSLCRKQLQICFYARVGGFFLALHQSICPSVRGPLSSLQIYSFSDFFFSACSIPLFADISEPSQEQGAGVPEQFTGLLHGSSPVFDCREDLFRLPDVQVSSQKQTEPKTLAKVQEEVPTVPPAPSRPNMAAILTDCDPKAIYATVHKEPKDSGSGVRARPPGDLKLARSLSKSDSDLLVSPPNEEEGGLGNRSESVSNCSSGKKRLEKSPSFTSEWDEVSSSSLRADHRLCCRPL